MKTFSISGLTSRKYASNALEYASSFIGKTDLQPSISTISRINPKVLNNVAKQKQASIEAKLAKAEQNNSKSGKRGSRPHKNVAKLNEIVNSASQSTSTSFNSGIDPKVIIDRNSSFGGEYSSLFLMNGCFFDQDKGFEDSSIYEYFNRHIYDEYKLAIQYALGNRSFSKFSSSDLFDYIHKITQALQVYYQVDSILAYFEDESNKPYNEGMIHLRSFLNADALDEFVELKNLLLQLPCPTNLVHFIRHMYQTFVFTQEDDSTLYKLGCQFSFYGDNSKEGIYNSILFDAISQLKDSDMKIPILLGKSVPNIIIKELPPSHSKPIYDNNFRNFWSNCDVTYFKSDLVYHTRIVDGKESHFNYITFNDNPDGLIYSCLSVYNTLTERTETGLWSPISDNSYYKDVNLDQRTSLLYYDRSNNSLRSLNKTACLCQSSVFHGVIRSKPDGGSDPIFVSYVNSHVGSLRTILNSIDRCRDVCFDSIRYLLGLNNSIW